MPIRNKEREMGVLRDFANKQAPSRVKATTKEIALFALEKAIDLSPFDTGQFMASWRISLSGPDPEFSESGKRSLSSARAEPFVTALPTIASLQLGTVFTISNAVPHAEFVEFGSPTSQPHYIVRRVTMAVGGKFGRI